MPAITAAGVAVAATTIVALVQALDEAVNQHNYQEAMRLKKKYDTLMSQSNLKISDIQRKLNQYNLNLNQVLSKYEGVSRAGKAFKNKGKIERAILENQKNADKAIKEEERIQSALTQYYQPKIDSKSNKTLTGSIIEAGKSIIK